jgi:hypothetical protein
MGSVRAGAKGSREVGIQEVVIPGSVAAHTVRIKQTIRQILLTTDRAGRVITIATYNWLSQLYRVLLKANGAL